MITIGVLGLQGAVPEHIQALEASGVQGIIVKRVEQLAEIDGLIIPGGESTAIRKLMDRYGFIEPLKQVAEQGMPIFGTCAGLILLAKKLEGYETSHIGVFDVTVERNSFGRQKDSFEAELRIKGLADPFVGVFIRAPHIVAVGENVEVLAEHNGRIVAAKTAQFLGCSFHPELTADSRMTEIFIGMVQNHLTKVQA
ncbi:pyridoxal 5'-phosphate synthase glutaminase subunit PdxT [Caldibacillus lycopersici]|uniref:Pyridoxal 5'-phosphate synthase subunit PdxT n=1 Tax=Perspicuibacillus lycopersici TaxID=1325689 RepID=A0AAE3IR75_9BACI|nr:pyridoxal 5'-phosphate synthase glutaminase subunit PdxT [Perspicuibacillus lycopersici]MCU9612946.1 pyridoxal 5'-phosphate synthase glutaminase subunit PdxT [Perspicuibacillus lycopersici]